MKALFSLVVIALGAAAHAQTNRFPPINIYDGNPVGTACTIPSSIVQSSTNGAIYSCIGGVYVGSGSATAAGADTQIQRNCSGSFCGTLATVDAAGNLSTPGSVVAGQVLPKQLGVATFMVDGFPSSCTVAGTAYTTQLDCAWYTAIDWINTNSWYATVKAGSGKYDTCAGLYLRSGSIGYQVSFEGLGMQTTTIQQTCSNTGGVFDFPARADASNLGPWHITNVTINPNYLASSCADLIGASFNVQIQHVRCLERTTGTSDHFMQIGDLSVPNNGGWYFQMGMDDILTDPSQDASHTHGNGAAAVTITVSGGSLAYSVTNGGATYSNPKLIITGYGAGAHPCTTMPTTSVQMSGGVITGVTETVASSGCSGNVYGYFYDLPNALYGLKLSHVTDSTISNLTASGGSAAAVYTDSGDIKFIHAHLGSLGPGGFNQMSPVGAILAGRGAMWGTNCGENGQYCFDLESQNAITDTMFYASILQGGQSTFYLGNSAGSTVQTLLCNQTQDIGDYHLAVTPTGPLDLGNISDTKFTSAQQCTGSKAVYSSPSVLHGYRMPYMSSSDGWVKIGTWAFSPNIAEWTNSVLTIDVSSKNAAFNPSYTKVVLRAGNGSAAPNITPVLAYGYTTGGDNAIATVKVVATGGSTSTTNNSWDVFLYVKQFSGGAYDVHTGYFGTWNAINAANVADPGPASSSIVVANVASTVINTDGSSTASLGTASTAGTQAATDNSTKLATTAFVQTAISAGGATFAVPNTGNGLPTGCVQYPCTVAQPAALLNQAAAVTTTTLLASAPAGRYRYTCEEVVTQTATTSSTLPGCQVIYTDPTTNASVFTVAGSGSTGNTVGANSSYSGFIDVKAGTTIQFQTVGYASSGATAMQYKLIIALDRVN